MLRAARLLGLSLVLVLAGCDGKDESEASSTKAPPDSAARTEIDRLRALGYVGFVEGSENDKRVGVVKYDRERSYPGYNLYSVRRMCTADLIDADGRVIRTWKDPSGWHWSNCELMPNGDLLVIGSRDGGDTPQKVVGATRFIMRYAWDGSIIWEKPLRAHHDIELTPREELAVLTRDPRRIPEVHPEAEVLDDRITRVSLAGKVLGSHSIYDLLSTDPDVFQFQPVATDTKSGTLEMGLLHSNSLEWMHRPSLFDKHPIYAPDNVLVCMRHQDAIAIFDLQREKVLWAWGQGELAGPHDANVLANGHILVFDNGLGRGWSRVIELDPLANEIVWQYKAPTPSDFYTAGRGSNQRLPNGNTLIAESDKGHTFEVTPDGEIVWEFYSPHFGPRGLRATIVRMKRYEVDYVQRILEQSESEG